MYEFINGNVCDISPTFAVIEAGGVGYYLNISLNTFSAIGSSPQAKLFTHFIVREDAQILYGFFNRSEREFFRLLIGVSGVGGNTARMILSTFAPAELQSVISTGKAEVLKGVKGLGIKTAQKIIVELKDKVIGIGIESGDSSAGSYAASVDSSIFEEAMSAMVMLGFTKMASEKTLKQLFSKNPDISVEDAIRQALKQM